MQEGYLCGNGKPCTQYQSQLRILQQNTEFYEEATVEQCMDYCSAHPECDGFNMDTSKGWCILRRQLDCNEDPKQVKNRNCYTRGKEFLGVHEILSKYRIQQTLHFMYALRSKINEI